MSGPERRARRRAGRDTVVDDDGSASLECRMRSPAEITAPAPPDLRKLALANFRERSRRYAREPDDVLIAHDQRVRAVDHRAHRELRLIGNADLAHEAEVEGRIEDARDLRRQRDAAPPRGENDRPPIPSCCTSTRR